MIRRVTAFSYLSLPSSFRLNHTLLSCDDDAGIGGARASVKRPPGCGLTGDCINTPNNFGLLALSRTGVDTSSILPPFSNPVSFRQNPIVIDRAEGCYFWDSSGKR